MPSGVRVQFPPPARNRTVCIIYSHFHIILTDKPVRFSLFSNDIIHLSVKNKLIESEFIMVEHTIVDIDISRYGYVYRIINTLNNKTYIGQHKISYKEKRRYYMGSGSILKQAMDKNGRDTFEKYLIEYADNQSELNDKETYYIQKEKLEGHGKYNILTIAGAHDTSTESRDVDNEEWRYWMRDIYDKFFKDSGNEIIKMYKSGLTITEIRTSYDFIPYEKHREHPSKNAISSFLKQSGIKLRDMTEVGHNASEKQIESIRKTNLEKLKNDDNYVFVGDKHIIGISNQTKYSAKPFEERECGICHEKFLIVSSDNRDYCEKHTYNNGKFYTKSKNILENELRHMYIDEGMSTNEIAKIYDCSNETIRKKLIKYNIQRRTPADGSRNYYSQPHDN